MRVTLEEEKKVTPEDYFMVATRTWESGLEDYLPVDHPSTAVQTFNDFRGAEKAYFSMKYSDCGQAGGKDIKLELLHMRFKVPHIVRNCILFP